MDVARHGLAFLSESVDGVDDAVLAEAGDELPVESLAGPSVSALVAGVGSVVGEVYDEEDVVADGCGVVFFLGVEEEFSVEGTGEAAGGLAGCWSGGRQSYACRQEQQS